MSVIGKDQAAAQALAGLCICLLGSPRLVRPDGSEHALERKDAALLALLAIDGITPRHKLAALMTLPRMAAREVVQIRVAAIHGLAVVCLRDR